MDKSWVYSLSTLSYPILFYIRWKTAVAFKRDTTFAGNGMPAQIIKNQWSRS